MNAKKILIYLLVILFSCNLLAQEKNNHEDKRVLILFSDSHEILVNRNMFITFEKILNPNNIKVLAEYLGDNSSVYHRDKETFLNFYKEKYGVNKKFDLVIAFNKEAINLCMENNEDLFPETNILLIDVFGQIAFEPPYNQQIRIITDLHQNLENLLIVSDNSDRGKILKEKVETYIDSINVLKNKAIYIDFAKGNFSDIRKYKYYSNKKSAVLLLSGYKDLANSEKSFSEQISFLNRELDLPIYTLYEKDLNCDMVGGYYLDVEKMVKQLSVKIILILNNMPIDEVSFNDMEFYQLFFNQNMADKYGINLKAYQDEAIIEKHEDVDSSFSMAIEIGEKLMNVLVFILGGLYLITAIKNRKYKKEIDKQKKVFYDRFNKSAQYIFMVDSLSGIIIDFNQRVTNSDFNDCVTKNESKLSDFFSSEIIKDIQKQAIGSNLQFRDIDFNCKKISIPIILSSLRYFDEGQDITFIQFIDNSTFKQEIIKLQRGKEDAENRVHESTNLIDNFVREIRNPLNLKRGFEKLIDNQDLTAEDKEKYTKIIKSNSQQLLGHIEKVLIFSELNNNTQIINNQEFSLNTQIRKITASLQDKLKTKGNNIKLVNYFSLSEGKDVLFNDKIYFSIVFKELLENAINFTDHGIIECGYTHPNEGKIIFYIKDTGIGMSAEEQREAFNKFNFQSRAEKKTNIPGIGIGLAICRNLITKMGGNIWLTAKENEGTTVYFYLDYDMSVYNGTQKLLDRSDIASLKEKKILIIDEDLGCQKFIIQALKKYDIYAKAIPNYHFYKKYNRDNNDFAIVFFDSTLELDEFFEDNKEHILKQEILLIIMTRTILGEDVVDKLKGTRYHVIYKPVKLQEMMRSLIE